MLKKFREFIQKNNLFHPHDRILLAVSGGADSATMAWLFHKCGFDFGMAHCNFGLRGAESDGDEYFVQEMAAKYNVPFYCKKFETLAYAREQGISIQMAAREMRFAFFEELLQKNKFRCTAIAHHRDDESETFFINLFRGTGIAGLKGYPPASGNIIRPLLFAGRKEIEAFAEKQGIRYRDDSSNREDKYIRNKIRNQIMPLVREINPDFENALSSEISRLQQVEKIYGQSIEEKKREITLKQNEVYKISIPQLMALPSPEAYLFGFLHPYGFSGDTIGQIFESAGKQAGKVFLSRTHRLVKDRDHYLITPLPADESQDRYEIPQGTKQLSNPISLRFEVADANKQQGFSASPDMAYFDYDKLKFPLILRKWKKGDAFFPFGMKGRKKLSDLFGDKKFSLNDKEKCWLLCSGNDIIWVVGVRSDNRYKVKRDTQKVLLVTNR